MNLTVHNMYIYYDKYYIEGIVLIRLTIQSMTLRFYIIIGIIYLYKRS